MIHKLFFIAGIIFMFIGVLLHHRTVFFMKHCGNPHRNYKRVIDWKMQKISMTLKLDSNQNIKLKKICEELQAVHDTLLPEHREIFQVIFAEVKQDSIDQEKLNGLIDQNLERVRKTIPIVLSKLAEFHATLTPEQKRQLVKRMEKHHKIH